jgi:hypothetical protein
VSTTVATKRVRRTWRIVALIALAVVGAAVMIEVLIEVFVVSSPVSIRTAERFLQGPPTFSYGGERGQPVARCHHTGLFGWSAEDACTLTFPSGDAYRCTVSPPRDSAGASASCASRPFRRV